jgi:hypothetical protein
MIDGELDKLVKKSKSYLDSINSSIDPQLTTLLHRYICILLSSNVDKSIQLIFTEFARTRGNKELKRFVAKKFERGTNYQTDKVIQALNTFDPSWGSEFDEKTKQTDLKEKLDALYGLRNSISHGEQVSISRPSLDGYYDAHKRAIALIRKLVLG